MPTDVHTRVVELLEALSLKRAVEVLDGHLPSEPGARNHALRVMEQVLRDQLSWRTERRIERRIKSARFPDMPTLESFDFDFQTGVDRELIMDLATLAWVDRHEDLILIGQSGVGKSHIAKALCLLACKQQRRVLYTSCAEMMSRLYASLADNSLQDILKRYTRPQLLLVDDLGYDPIEQEQAREAQLLYKVLEARHQHASTIITSNMPADEWPDYLGNHYLTIALLDRLLFHGTAITIDGPSWRLAQHHKRRAERGKPSDNEE